MGRGRGDTRGSVMEEAELRVDERDPVLAARRLHLGVARGSPRLGDEAHAVLARVIDVVAEGDEAGGDEGDAVEPRGPGAPLVVAEGIGGAVEGRAQRSVLVL